MRSRPSYSASKSATTHWKAALAIFTERKAEGLSVDMLHHPSSMVIRSPGDFDCMRAKFCHAARLRSKNGALGHSTTGTVAHCCGSHAQMIFEYTDRHVMLMAFCDWDQVPQRSFTKDETALSSQARFHTRLLYPDATLDLADQFTKQPNITWHQPSPWQPPKQISVYVSLNKKYSQLGISPAQDAVLGVPCPAPGFGLCPCGLISECVVAF